MTVEAIADPWTPEEAVAASGRALGARRAPRAAGLPTRDARRDRPGARSRSTRQGLARPPRTARWQLDADYDPELLRSVSILKISDEEAELLVDGYDERALARLGVPEVVVTLGSRGCIVYADGVAELVRATPVAERDPTGAGDAFATAYLAARSGGAAPTSAARRAAALVTDLLAGRAA